MPLSCEYVWGEHAGVNNVENKMLSSSPVSPKRITQNQNANNLCGTKVKRHFCKTFQHLHDHRFSDKTIDQRVPVARTGNQFWRMLKTRRQRK